jgi:hypothetical protein
VSTTVGSDGRPILAYRIRTPATVRNRTCGVVVSDMHRPLRGDAPHTTTAVAPKKPLRGPWTASCLPPTSNPQAAPSMICTPLLMTKGRVAGRRRCQRWRR